MGSANYYIGSIVDQKTNRHAHSDHYSKFVGVYLQEGAAQGHRPVGQSQ